ncbi:MAG: response regulator [Propionibacteriaceae bacterium]|jgi:DNA-binding response OmpR family regulator|nr:response regulator [Propionibacteriaceae bacterium]
MSDTAAILLYSSDRTVREAVKAALGKRVAADVPPLEITEAATEPIVFQALDSGKFDLAILDGEANPSGGFGIAHRIKDELADPPPVLLLVVRVADAWLATWSGAEAVTMSPINPLEFPGLVAKLLR